MEKVDEDMDSNTNVNVENKFKSFTHAESQKMHSLVMINFLS